MARESDESSLLLHTGKYRVQWQRWWIALWYSLFTIVQSSIYVTYNPLAGPTKKLYHVTDKQVNLFAAIGPYATVPMMFPVAWLLLRKGLRVSMIGFGILVTLASCIRMAGTGPSTFHWVMVGQVMNGLAGPISLIAITQISSVWFPPNERTLATSITSTASWVGSALGFVTGLFIFTEEGLKLLVMSQSIAAGVIALVLIAYFPAKPKTPPAPSQEDDMKRQPRPYIYILKEFLMNPWFMVIVLISGASNGIYNGWITTVDVTLAKMGWNQSQAAWLSFISIISGTIFTCVLAKFADVVKGKFKIILVSLFLLSSLCFLCFTLSILEIIPYNYWAVLVLGIMGGTFVIATGPMCYEFVVELTYPLPEATSAGILSAFSNIVNIAFVYVADYASPLVLDWLIIGCFALFGLILIFLRDDYRRLQVDVHSDSIHKNAPIINP